ncbi:antibiotic ABC transporter ATP-binding protein [Pedobacter ginsengisoli]|uniref:Antibiotic ABC transporter ATP-binding protein n=1 Tax=Pedobacter ginsengisoli TaxID=363852 RepID=A0A2D1UA77_9SPHI|nr:ABC transporter ATP-binding protein [Pedobacter ginsengisoli]ATP58496.1 antibiotic ABC transporter ATP-binding protein [Pedobacter ginsengisoli]
MKIYFRLLSFAKPIEKFAIPYVITTVLSVIFSVLNLTLLAPLFETLISDEPTKSSGLADNAASAFNITAQFKEFVNSSIITNGQEKTLTYICLIIVLSVLLSNIFRYFSQRSMEDLRVHTLLNLRKTVFENVMNLHVGYFNNERKGDIISKVSADVQVVQFTVTNTLQVVFKEPLTLIFYVLVLLSISIKLTLFSLLVIPISAFVISKIVKRIKHQAKEAHESFAKMIGFLDEALGGIKIIKAFNASERIKERFHNENVFYSNINRKMVRRQQLGSPLSEFLSIVMVSFIVWYGGRLIISHQPGALSTSQFIAYIAIFSQVMRPAKALTDSFSGIHTGIAAGERVLDLIDTKAEQINKPDAKEISSFNNSLVFENVSFSYESKEVLKNINLTIQKGKTIALVGPSGGGKSTLMDLIPRFHDPKSGSIKIDGLDYADLTVESIRSQLGMVNQESILFNDTIFNNIAFAKPDATEAEVIAAAKIANAHDFILQTENGYETYTGDRGNKLSGGQKQRLCIARAILANPPIMLLDEATSALDTESEKLVQDALNKLMENRTSLVIAHRLSTIHGADLIVVIDKGEIIETGTHQELLSHNGLYKKLIELQTFS